MHRARLLVAQYARETARRRLGAPASNALRAWTDSSRRLAAAEEGLLPSKGGIEHAGAAGTAAEIGEDGKEKYHHNQDDGSQLEEQDDVSMETVDVVYIVPFRWKHVQLLFSS